MEMKKNIFGNIQEGNASVIIFHDIHQTSSSNKLKEINKIIQFYNSIRNFTKTTTIKYIIITIFFR